MLTGDRFRSTSPAVTGRAIRGETLLSVTWAERVNRMYHSPRDYLDAAQAKGAGPELLAGLATLPYSFVRQAVAEHANTAPETLLVLVPEELRDWRHQALLATIVSHPAANDEVFARAREKVRQALATGKRPYRIAITLAARGALSPGDVEVLGQLPGVGAIA